MHRFSPPVSGLSSRFRLREMQAARVYTTAQVWVPAGLRGACSGRSKSRNITNSGGEFAQLEPTRAMGNPEWSLFLFFTAAASFAFLKSPQQPSKPRQSRYNSSASCFSLYDSHGRGCCVLCERACVYPTAVGTERVGAISFLFFAIRLLLKYLLRLFSPS